MTYLQPKCEGSVAQPGIPPSLNKKTSSIEMELKGLDGAVDSLNGRLNALYSKIQPVICQKPKNPQSDCERAPMCGLAKDMESIKIRIFNLITMVEEMIEDIEL